MKSFLELPYDIRSVVYEEYFQPDFQYVKTETCPDYLFTRPHFRSLYHLYNISPGLADEACSTFVLYLEHEPKGLRRVQLPLWVHGINQLVAFCALADKHVPLAKMETHFDLSDLYIKLKFAQNDDANSEKGNRQLNEISVRSKGSDVHLLGLASDAPVDYPLMTDREDRKDMSMSYYFPYGWTDEDNQGTPHPNGECWGYIKLVDPRFCSSVFWRKTLQEILAGDFGEASKEVVETVLHGPPDISQLHEADAAISAKLEELRNKTLDMEVNIQIFCDSRSARSPKYWFDIRGTPSRIMRLRFVEKLIKIGQEKRGLSSDEPFHPGDIRNSVYRLDPAFKGRVATVVDSVESEPRKWSWKGGLWRASVWKNDGKKRLRKVLTWVQGLPLFKN